MTNIKKTKFFIISSSFFYFAVEIVILAIKMAMSIIMILTQLIICDKKKANMKYFLSLGSNLGDKKSNLSEAFSFLKGKGKILKVSSIYETSPVQMPSDTEYFLNLVLELDSCLAPEKLLGSIKKYERNRGRKRKYFCYESRIIDIDILLADKLVIQKRKLVIPHPEMIKRAFVLIPLYEIAPYLVHPVLNKTIQRILADLKTIDGVAKINTDPEV